MTRRGLTRTYLDAGVLIGTFRQDLRIVQTSYDVINDPRRVFVGSVFLRLEVLPKAAYHRQSVESGYYRRFFARVDEWVPVTDDVVALAEREAERHGLNALDALHVASAILLNADEFATTEKPRKPIHRVTGVKVVAI